MCEPEVDQLTATRRLLAAAHLRLQRYEQTLLCISYECPFISWAEKARKALAESESEDRQ